MNRRQLLLILIPLFFLLPAAVHGLSMESRTDLEKLPQQAPMEQLVFISAVSEEARPSLSVRPALLQEPGTEDTALYKPDGSVPEESYSFSRDAQIYLPPEFFHEGILPLTPAEFPEAYLALIRSGASPIFLMANREHTVYRLEYVHFAQETPLPSRKD